MANNTLCIGGCVTSQGKMAFKASALVFLYPTSAVNPPPDIQEIMLHSVYKERSQVQCTGESVQRHTEGL